MAIPINVWHSISKNRPSSSVKSSYGISRNWMWCLDMASFVQLKIVTNTHEAVLLLVKLQKLKLLHGCFWCFLNCKNGTKSCEMSQVLTLCFNPLTNNVPLNRNQSTGLLCKLIDWCLFEKHIGRLHISTNLSDKMHEPCGQNSRGISNTLTNNILSELTYKIFRQIFLKIRYAEFKWALKTLYRWFKRISFLLKI